MKKWFTAVTPMWGETHIEYNKSFDVFGIAFAIHKFPSGGKYYSVSEIATGMRLLPSIYKTMAQAEKEARSFLAEKGEATVRKVITKGKRANTMLRKKLKEASIGKGKGK